MDSLLFAFNTVSPIVLLIVVGYVLKRIGMFPESWFKLGNKMVFRICLPVMLFINIYNIESFADIDWSVVLFAEVAILFFVFVGFFLGKYCAKYDEQKGVLMQCVFRSNYAIIGLSLAASMGSVEALGIASVLGAFTIPPFNIFTIVAFNLFQKDEKGNRASFKTVLIQCLKNPLIVAALCGLAVLCIRSVIPTGSDGLPVFSLKGNLPFAFEALNGLSKMCTPFALVTLGGLFNFSAIKSLLKPIVWGTVFRTLIVPLIAISSAVLLSNHTGLLQFDRSVYPALLALFASPCSVSSVSMAQEMDSDAALAGQLVVWTSIFSMFTMFLFIFVMRNIGLL